MRTLKLNRSGIFKLVIAFGLMIAIGCSSGGGGGGGGGGGTCERGPGSNPISGGGTENDPYIISLGVSYGGCARAQEDPGPIYGIELTVSGNYTITQTNGVTDLELWIYEENGTLLGVIDDKLAGYDESDTNYATAGKYGIEVYNDGDQDGPFTLIVTGP